MLMWGKDHATRASAKTLTYVIEKINLCNEAADAFEYVVHETYGETIGQEDKEFVRYETRKSNMGTP